MCVFIVNAYIIYEYKTGKKRGWKKMREKGSVVSLERDRQRDRVREKEEDPEGDKERRKKGKLIERDSLSDKKKAKRKRLRW